jgi:hypothetical protein
MNKSHSKPTREAAYHRGKRMAFRVQAGKPFEGNPYLYVHARAEHEAWARAFIRWRGRLNHE